MAIPPESWLTVCAAAYDEDDNGFNFSRKRSKRIKAQAQPQSESQTEILVDQQQQQQQQQPQEPTQAQVPIRPASSAPRQRRTTRKTLPVSPEVSKEPPRRRSKRISENHEQAVTEAIVETRGQDDRLESITAPTAGPDSVATPKRPHAEEQSNQGHSPVAAMVMDGQELQGGKERRLTKIPLPFADTPIIHRNKEMRKTGAEQSRRSSSGMRGRRASSLIDSGTSNGTCFVHYFVAISTPAPVLSAFSCQSRFRVEQAPTPASKPGPKMARKMLLRTRGWSGHRT